MAKFRCNFCVHCEDDFCSKLGEFVSNPLAKLFFGGAVDLFSSTKTCQSECGIEKGQKITLNSEIEIIVTEEMPRISETTT